MSQGIVVSAGNVEVVQRHYAAFGRGELSSILDTFTEDVEFQSPVSRSRPPLHGRDQVAGFFKELLGTVQIENFQLLSFTAQDERVVVEGRNRGNVKPTGRSFEHDWVMVFTIRDGRIAKAKHYYDSSDLAEAIAGQPR